MRVRISDISDWGLNIKGNISADALNARIRGGAEKGGKEGGFFFTAAPFMDLTISRSSHGGLANGKISAKYRQLCALCLKDVERDVEIDAQFLLYKRPEGFEPGSDKEYEDDVGIFHYEGEYADLEPIVQELLILSLSVYWHPLADENGSCTVCGKNMTELACAKSMSKSETLASLLKKAGIS